MGSYGVKLSRLCLVTALHPAASGRIYAAYGGIYIFTALMWLRYVDQVMLTHWDILGGIVVLCGACLIILQPQGLVR
jgi:small multidrug resistance family-3 protein